MHGIRIAVLSAISAGVSASADTRLADAAKRADWAAVRELTNKADVDAKRADGSTALHWAVYHDDLETVRALLGTGADIAVRNRYGVAPISVACTNGSPAVVQALLEAGADANMQLPGGESALMSCARTGRVETVRALIRAGADVRAKEGSGQTALHWAAAEGHVSVVELLIEHGADFRSPLPSGYTPFLFAVREGRIEVVKSLLKAGVSPNETVRRDGSAAKVSQGQGWPRAGTSALTLAALNAHLELGALLLDAGADPNHHGAGYGPLHVVTWIRKPGRGDNDPAPDGSGRVTSLEFVKKLIAKGADPNLRMSKKIGVGMTSLNTSGATAFLLAARTGDAELMRLLASLGADPKIPTEDNATPLIVAAGLGTRSPGEDAGTEAEVLEAVAAALELGNEIDAADNNGETAMHGAAYKNLPAVVEFLASKGARIEVWNRKNRFGWTPLTIAEGYRFGNYKPSPPTIAAFRKVMLAAGVTPPPPTPPPGSTAAGSYQ
jgi:ankyrin repeat protein